MINNYKDFEIKVKSFSKHIDFKENKNELKNIDFKIYDTFLRLLKIGSEIIPAIYVSEEILKISKSSFIDCFEIYKIIIKSKRFNMILEEENY